ncbi:tetratricopeptide repeat protein [Bacillus paranthracis]
MNQIGKPIPSLLYHMALTFSHLQNSVLAIYYTNESLKVYSNQMNYQRIIDCKMIIGINYIRVKRWEEAEKEFNNIMKVASAINNKVVMATVYHNLGYLYSKKGNHDAAMRNFQLSLDLKGTKRFLVFYYNLVFGNISLCHKKIRRVPSYIRKGFKRKKS